jgi:ribosomal RNA-processing protein 7
MHGAAARHAQGLRSALEAAKPGASPQEAPPVDPAAKRGLAGWLAEHRGARPGLEVLQAEVDAWVAAHDAEAAETAARLEEEAAGDDGWTVVGAKRGRRKTTDGEGTAVGGVAPAKAARAKLSAGPETHADFYRFQKRENQRAAVAELRKRFEEDKQRIAELRAARKFKPS